MSEHLQVTVRLPYDDINVVQMPDWTDSVCNLGEFCGVKVIEESNSILHFSY